MQIRMFDKLFNLDNKPRVKLHHFKNRQWKRQPYIIETYFKNKAFTLYIYPFCIDSLKVFKSKDYFLSLPGFKFSYKEYSNTDDGRYESEWGNLVEDEPF